MKQLKVRDKIGLIKEERRFFIAFWNFLRTLFMTLGMRNLVDDAIRRFYKSIDEIDREHSEKMARLKRKIKLVNHKSLKAVKKTEKEKRHSDFLAAIKEKREARNKVIKDFMEKEVK